MVLRRLTSYLPICEVFQLKQAITTELRVCMTFCFFTLRNKGERKLICYVFNQEIKT